MRHLGPLTAPLLLTSLLFAAPATGQLPVLRTVDSPTDSHGFGEAAAVIGDFDGDGTLDYAVSEVNGLPLPKVDAVHVISGATGAILATFVEEAAGDDFGEALAGVGDLDGDGSPDLLIGASEHDTGGLHSAGRATVVSGATGAVLLAFGGTDTNHDLGQSVAAIGDVDGDGKTDFAIASPGEDLLGHKSGVARLHRGSDGAVLQTYGNGLTTADLADSYADQVAAAGDLDGDGVPDVLVSAHGRLNSPHGRPGAIEARSGADGSLLFELRDDLTPHHAQQFGRSLTEIGRAHV